MHKQIKQTYMEDLIEFETVAYYIGEELQETIKHYEEMGIEVPKDIMKDKEEVIVKYNFDCSDIIEVRQTFVSYKGEKLDGVVVTFKDDYYTPILLTTMEEFKKRVNEHNQKKS